MLRVYHSRISGVSFIICSSLFPTIHHHPSGAAPLAWTRPLPCLSMTNPHIAAPRRDIDIARHAAAVAAAESHPPGGGGAARLAAASFALRRLALRCAVRPSRLLPGSGQSLDRGLVRLLKNCTRCCGFRIAAPVVQYALQCRRPA